MLAIGLPRPETQVPVATRLGTYWADLGWPEARVLAEYDGEAKYTDASRDVVVREKRREDALLDEGWRMLRLTKDDLRHPATLTRRARPLFPGIPLTPRPDLTL
ncbi:hypothetical protein GXB85_16185 [Cellulomonas sp. APG4]|uniref:hypothetical protein n=1 Tax=Cellulomonas sp. APG4 TaxID=1538656 RepID=UPI00137B840B|nr:hypothetical protein [Cellulomonas sp. APG4]NCT92476.1 hypothetical protein [Cellulomonas sp. APG4]